MPNILEGCHPNGSERAQLACCRYCWYSFPISKHYPAISVDIHSIETPLDAANRTVLPFLDHGDFPGDFRIAAYPS